MALLDILDCTMDDLIDRSPRPRRRHGGRRPPAPRTASGTYDRNEHYPRRRVTTIEQDRVISDPVGLITDLVSAADPSLAPDRIQSAVVAVAGGRAKSRRLAAVLRRMRQTSADLHPQGSGLVLQLLRTPPGLLRELREDQTCEIIDRGGLPRCAQCCDVDQRDPMSVIHSIVAELDPRVARDTIVSAVNQCCRQAAYQQKLAWAIEADDGAR